MRELPEWDSWQRYVKVEPVPAHWEQIAEAVAHILDHQSQEATDCRWLTVMCMVTGGFLHLPSREMAEEFFGYPDHGDQRKVRPSIRATEGAFFGLDGKQGDWARRFWIECHSKTPCKPWPIARTFAHPTTATSVHQVQAVTAEVVTHCARHRASTAVDARYDAAFGLSLYALSILRDLLSVGIGASALGRMALRTLMEIFVTLAYLVKKNQSEAWTSYRSYGSGQAKLAFLKLDELETPPTYVSVTTLESLANEDLWQEFQTINLGQWDNSNLRKMSEEAGVKDVYDRFYGWTSGFVHGQWGAVRETSFQICANPLHRIHRIPLDSTRSLADVVPDASFLVDRILGLLDALYPGLSVRVAIE